MEKFLIVFFRKLTLVELMITVAILSMVMLMIVSFYRSGMLAYTRYSEKQERIERLDGFLETLATELTAAERIEYVEPNRIGYREKDREENGLLVPGRVVMYEWCGDPYREVVKNSDYDEKTVLAGIERLEFQPAPDRSLLRLMIIPEKLPRLDTILPVPSPETERGK